MTKAHPLILRLALWARSQQRKRPSSKAEWQHLIAEYAEWEKTQPAWDEIDHEPPLEFEDDGATVQIVDRMPNTLFKDEWQDLMQKKEQAKVGPDGQLLLDDFDQEWQFNEQQVEALENDVHWARTNPKSFARAILGGTATIKSNTLSENAIMVAYWEGEDADAKTLTVTCGFLNKLTGAQAAALNAFRPFCLVKWGTRGNLVQAEIDVEAGKQFSLAGSACYVSFGADDLSGRDGATGNAGSMALFGSISGEPIVRAVAMTRTKYIDALGSGASSTVFVPNFAANVLFQTNSATATYVITFLDIIGTALYSTTVAAATLQTVPFPLSGDVYQIKVANNNATGPTNCELIFGLDL